MKSQFHQNTKKENIMNESDRDWHKDMEIYDQYRDSELPFKHTVFAEMLFYWLREAKEQKEHADHVTEERQRFNQVYIFVSSGLKKMCRTVQSSPSNI
jgi:hypothetical protein